MSRPSTSISKQLYSDPEIAELLVGLEQEVLQSRKARCCARKRLDGILSVPELLINSSCTLDYFSPRHNQASLTLLIWLNEIVH